MAEQLIIRTNADITSESVTQHPTEPHRWVVFSGDDQSHRIALEAFHKLHSEGIARLKERNLYGFWPPHRNLLPRKYVKN